MFASQDMERADHNYMSLGEHTLIAITYYLSRPALASNSDTVLPIPQIGTLRVLIP
jgi:wobble nucleotide-excising tRNase